MVMEFCTHGDMKTFLRACRPGGASQKMSLGKSELRSMALDVCHAMRLVSRMSIGSTLCTKSLALIYTHDVRYLAGLNIIHRDLSARNILVTGMMRAKVADFGFSRVARLRHDAEAETEGYYRYQSTSSLPGDYC